MGEHSKYARLGSVYIEDSFCPSNCLHSIPHTRTARGKDRPTLPDVLCGGAVWHSDSDWYLCAMQSTHTRVFIHVCLFTLICFLPHHERVCSHLMVCEEIVLHPCHLDNGVGVLQRLLSIVRIGLRSIHVHDVE